MKAEEKRIADALQEDQMIPAIKWMSEQIPGGFSYTMPMEAWS